MTRFDPFDPYMNKVEPYLNEIEELVKGSETLEERLKKAGIIKEDEFIYDPQQNNGLQALRIVNKTQHNRLDELYMIMKGLFGFRD